MRTFLLLLLLMALITACNADEAATPTMAPTAAPVEELTRTPPALPTALPGPETVSSPTSDPSPTTALPATLTPVPTATALPAATEPTASPTKESVVTGQDHVVDPQLIDAIWQWEKRTSNGGEEMLIEIPDPESYTIVFNMDGSLEAALDCGESGGNYATDGTGGILMALDTPEASQCGPESYASAMANMFGPAQNYDYEEDGQVVVFKWVAGGSWDSYRRSGTATPETADTNIFDVIWQWEAFQDEAGLNDLTLADPEKYTLALQTDGTAAIQADCNQVTWTYSLDSDAQGLSGSLTFDTTGPSTSAFCGDESLDQQYLTWLGETAAFVVVGEELFLNLRFDSGNMIFDRVAGQPESETGSGATGEVPADFIQLDLQGLAESYEWEVVPGTSISSGPGGQGFPNHIVLEFDGESTIDLPYSERRIMYVFPTQATIDLYNASGIDSASQQIERLQELIDQADGRQEMPVGTMPLLPPPGSLMDRWVQFSDLDFTQGQGVRYVSDSPFRQSIGVWTNETTDYYYQGLTEDGRYYISFKWPVSTALLPDTVSDASEELNQQASSSRESYDVYESELKATLNALSAGEWSPNLSSLDAMIASLAFVNE